MGLSDNIISIIIIVFVVIIATMLLFNIVSTQQQTQATQSDIAFLQDYYSTSINTFLQLTDTQLERRYNDLLGEYIYTGKRFQDSPQGIVDIRRSAEETLNELFGPGNFYLRVEPQLSKIQLSFIFPGGRSMLLERQLLAQELSEVQETIRAFFPEETTITLKVYIPSTEPANSQEVCGPFIGLVGVECERLGQAQLYRSEHVQRPTFGFASHSAWLASNRYAQPEAFWINDWAAAVSYVGEEFIEEMIREQDPSRLHIIIPVSDKVTTGGNADECFRVEGINNFFPCSYCNDDCPTHRGEFIPAIRDSFNQTPTIFLPVYTTECRFEYRAEVFNDLPSTAYNSQFASFPLDENIASMCVVDTCNACKPRDDPLDYERYCLHHNCWDALIEQKQTLAGPNGTIVGVDETDILVTSIMEALEDLFEEMTLEAGIYDPTRTRFVYERTLTLPRFATSTVRFYSYEEQYVDDDPPIFNNIEVRPRQGPEGTTFTIFAEIDDIHPFTANAQLYDEKKNFTSTFGLYRVNFSTDGLEEEDHTVLLEAIDVFNNRAEEQAIIRINNTDTIPPEINGSIPYEVRFEEGFFNILANATDNFWVENVTATITLPDGTQEIIDLIELEFERWGVSYDLSQIGIHQIVLRAYDAAGNVGEWMGTVNVHNRRLRILMAPIGFTSEAQWSSQFNNHKQFIESITPPFNQCMDPSIALEIRYIPPDVCSDLGCSQQAGDWTNTCYACLDNTGTCYSKWREEFPNEDHDYDYLAGVNAWTVGNLGGCAPRPGSISWSVSSSVTIGHELGHNYGLCHAPGGGAAGAGGFGCPNRQEQQARECIMNYLRGGPQIYCPEATRHLNNIFSEFEGSC